MSKFSDFSKILAYIDQENIYPQPGIIETNDARTIVDGKRIILFCSLNYLGLANNENIKKAAIQAIQKHGIGSGGSRFVSGNYQLHNDLEKEIAEFKKEEAGLIFQSGFAANIGVIPAIINTFKIGPFANFQNRGVIFSDELNHTSIIDGCKISKAKVIIYKHCDINDLEDNLKKFRNERKLIVTDSVFSMDGDVAPLKEIVDLAKKYNAYTMIDEAHGVGVLGDGGEGASVHFNLQGQIDIVMGTFSKALGCVGGYIVGKKDLVRYLKLVSHPSMFSVSMPPGMAAAAIAAIKELKNHPELPKNLKKNSDYLRNGLRSLGYDILTSQTNIIPVLIGDERRSILISKRLFDNNIYVPSMRWPAVAKGKARLRITLMATHTKDDLDTLLNVMSDMKKF